MRPKREAFMASPRPMPPQPISAMAGWSFGPGGCVMRSAAAHSSMNHFGIEDAAAGAARISGTGGGWYGRQGVAWWSVIRVQADVRHSSVGIQAGSAGVGPSPFCRPHG
jgi:hypothetical protein